jgi:hypothetical protein
MNDKRVMLCGRVAGSPAPIPGIADSAIVTLHVPRGARTTTWAAIFGPAVRLSRPLANGDAVAIIGEVDMTRGDGELLGPVAVEAALVLNGEGEIFRNLESKSGDGR